MASSVEEGLRSRVAQLEKELTQVINKIGLISEFLEQKFSGGINFHTDDIDTVNAETDTLEKTKVGTFNGRGRYTINPNCGNSSQGRISDPDAEFDRTETSSTLDADTGDMETDVVLGEGCTESQLSFFGAGSIGNGEFIKIEGTSDENMEEHLVLNNVRHGTSLNVQESARKSHVAVHLEETTAASKGNSTNTKFSLFQGGPSAGNNTDHKRRFKCVWSDCSKRFRHHTLLETHFRIHTGEKPFKCTWPSCERSFAMKGTLVEHLKIHIGEKPFKCTSPGCGKSFRRSYTLTVHRRYHTGEKPYSCRFCEWSFAEKSSLTIHMRTHTGERPYKCEVCHVGFISSCNLQKHKKRHHGGTGHDLIKL